MTKNNLKKYPDNFPRILEIIKAKKIGDAKSATSIVQVIKITSVENLSEDFDSIVPSDYKSKCLRCLKRNLIISV